MQEYAGVRQIPGEPRRRWFGSKEFDLIVRVSDSQEFIDFELCYDKHHDEHSLTWSKTAGFSHMAVDDGEAIMGRYKQTPILVPDGAFDIRRIHAAFLKASRSLPQDVTRFVLRALEQHPDFSIATN